MISGPGDLVLTNICKSYGPQPVLDGLDLRVPSGSLMAVLGVSGCGKTTLLRLVAGFERLDGGSIALGQTVLDDNRVHTPPDRRHVGYVSQDGSLFPHLDVAANVAFGLSRSERKGEKVQGLLETVGLTGFGHRYPHQLSGGQQQRVALARALAVDPQIVLLDEPFASLDPSLRARLRADVDQILRSSGATVVLVTQDLDEALSMGDRVAVVRAGAVAQVGTPRELYSSPIDPELAEFVGDANLVSGTPNGAGVDTAFGVLEIQGVNAAISGESTVLIRPEQIELLPDQDNRGVAGRVEHLEFFGFSTIARVALEDKDGLPDHLTVRTLGPSDLTVGARVRLRVRGPVHLWPNAGGSGSSR